MSGQLNSLRAMLFEVEAEREPLLKGRDLILEVGSKLWVKPLGSMDQIGKSRHKARPSRPSFH